MQYQANALKSFPKIIGIGKNYAKHVKEMGGVEPPKTPILFFKPWSSVNYTPKSVRLPLANTHRIDHQLELGVYIGKGGSNIPKQAAFEHVGGYFLGIDFSDRDYQNAEKSKGEPWSLSKGQDNFCPISEFIEKSVDPYAIELEMIVNGQTRQKEITGSMIFKIDELISYISQFIKFEEGDLILTGTPDGVGPVKGGDKLQGFARIGDKVLAKLDFDVTI